MKRAWILIVAVSVVLCMTPAASFADASPQSGWWTTAPAATAPDVPAGGILVQGGPTADRPLAFGAVDFVLTPNKAPGVLTLAVAANSATTPNASITACPLTKTFSAAAGGPMADAPTFDCSAKATATRSADGKIFTIDTATLARNNAVAVALLPTVVTDRIVLDKPDGSALSTSGPSGPVTSSGVITSSPVNPSPAVGTTGRTPVAPGTPAAAPAATPAAQPAPAAASGAPRAVVTRATSGAKSSKVGFAFIALLVLTAALWLFAGNSHAESPEATPALSTSPGGASP